MFYSLLELTLTQFASTDCPFRMSGAGSSVEAVCFGAKIAGGFLDANGIQITHVFAVHFQPVGVMQ